LTEDDEILVDTLVEFDVVDIEGLGVGDDGGGVVIEEGLGGGGGGGGGFPKSQEPSQKIPSWMGSPNSLKSDGLRSRPP